MIDYHALRAISAVIELQSFEQAARALGISQSAVSQRIGTFEAYVGERLLVRKLPYTATVEGEKYLGLLRKVTSLEEAVLAQAEQKPSLKIAINRDSLDLFFLEVLGDEALARTLSIEVTADDQINTLGYLKSGQVDMCITNEERAIPGHTSTPLGTMNYVLACSAGFYKIYFKSGITRHALLKAPAVVFDHNDKILFQFLQDHFGVSTPEAINKLPSVVSFKQGILSGFGYGLMPLMDIEKEIRSKRAVNLAPKHTFRLPLYLHQWEYQKNHVKVFNERVLKAAKKIV